MPRTLCIDCRAIATTACPRCSLPLCAAHGADKSRRCTLCESGYLSREQRGVRIVGVALGALIVSAMSLGGLLTHLVYNGLLAFRNDYLTPLFVPMAGLSLLLVFSAPSVVRPLIRWKFLREKNRAPNRDARVELF